MGPPTTIPSAGRLRPRRAAAGDGDPLDLVRLRPLMARTEGIAEIVIGLVDGPVARGHPDLATGVRTLSGGPTACRTDDLACLHGTFVAGVLAARRGTAAPAVSPGCTLLVRPVFGAMRLGPHELPSATSEELAAAMLECIDGGARILNVSAVVTEARGRERGRLAEALDLAARRHVLVVVAAGNAGVVTSSTLTRHPWVIPVVACSGAGRPVPDATLGRSIGRSGLGAPGEAVTSLVPGGGTVELGGSSVAAPFVSGTAALLWSLNPRVPGAAVRAALVSGAGRRGLLVPPLLDAERAHQVMTTRKREDAHVRA